MKGATPKPGISKPVKRIKKLIDLDEWVVSDLKKKAKADNRPVKSYIESVVIQHVLDGGYPVAQSKKGFKNIFYDKG